MTGRPDPPRKRRLPRPAGGDAGVVTVLLLLLTPALFALGGLVLDGGTHLAARQHAAGLAEQAARAGADQLEITALRSTGTAVLDEPRARAAACRYVRTVEPDASCTAAVRATPTGPEVEVRVRTRTPTVLLGLIGVNTLNTGAVGAAQAVSGIRTTALTPPPSHHRPHTAGRCGSL